MPKTDKILIVASRHPWPPRRGDQARALQMAELLAAQHEVTLLVPGGRGGGGEPGPPRRGDALPFRVATYRRASRGSAALGLARSIVDRAPLQSGLFRNPALGTALGRLAPDHDLVILQLVRLAPFLSRIAGRPVLVDLVDSLALSTARRAALDRPILRPLLRHEAARLGRWERRMVRETAGTLVVSGRDRDAIAVGLDPDDAARLHVVPLAVPGKPGRGSADASPAGPPTLVLTGNLGYFPTREGLTWFLEAVWPRLRSRRPELRLEVAGSRPGRALRRALARSGGRLAEAPADLAPFLARATIAIAPMRGGAGQPMKVVEAWAAGVPVVATSWAAAGTTGVPGEDLLVADEPEDWCRAVGSLLDDPERRRRVANAARERLRRDYAVEAVRRRLEAVVRGASA